MSVTIALVYVQLLLLLQNHGTDYAHFVCQAVMSFLNELFGIFDELCDLHKVFKVRMQCAAGHVIHLLV